MNKDNDFFKIYEAANQAKNNEVEGIVTLYKMSLNPYDENKLNKMLIKSTLLGMIKGNSKTIHKYILAVDSKFLALEPMNFLGQAPFQVKCVKCTGQGFLKLRCKDCNKGVCKNCKGKKQIVYKGLGRDIIVKKCITCEATGKCIGCNATGTVPQTCWTCVEKGTVKLYVGVLIFYSFNYSMNPKSWFQVSVINPLVISVRIQIVFFCIVYTVINQLLC